MRFHQETQLTHMYSTYIIINTQMSVLNLFTHFFIQVGYYQDEKEKISFFFLGWPLYILTTIIEVGRRK